VEGEVGLLVEERTEGNRVEASLLSGLFERKLFGVTSGDVAVVFLTR
jgi:hypothetical protein